MQIKSKGVTMTALLAKATAMALVQHPVVNSSCRDGKSFTYSSSINIAVAVAIDGGLITPVLQDADKVKLFVYLPCTMIVDVFYDLLNKWLLNGLCRLTFIHCQGNGRSWLIRRGQSSCSRRNTTLVFSLITNLKM